MKLIFALTFVGFLGLQCIVNAQAQDSPKDQMGKNQTNNESKKETIMNTSNKFEFQPLPYSYDALEPFIDKLTVEIKSYKLILNLRTSGEELNSIWDFVET